MKKIKYILLFTLFIGYTVQAQSGFTSISWGWAMAQNEDMKNFVGNDLNMRGFGVDMRFFVRPRLTAGFSIRWDIFRTTRDEQLSFRSDSFNGDITGKQWHYINTFPLLANMHYYFGGRNTIQFYLGGSAGISYIRERFDIGLFTLEASNWHFTIVPEAGFTYPITRQTRLYTNLRYNYSVAAGKSITGDPKGYSYIGIDLGLAFYYW
ncbi:MAG TPA: hypothetical protein ENK44_02780 [Caldithrix abyssi]|uniref:Outer membrane protein beta-barrel domain-containing protein n=1 Tax=Caldithrix abyssi TaxID=187145 RepID=A0A7V4TY69_CALAY|nr:hypothetical protein [Caldithrix abyssi]